MFIIHVISVQYVSGIVIITQTQYLIIASFIKVCKEKGEYH